MIEAATKRAKRLFNKNTGLCEGETLRIGADACPVPEGQWEDCKVRTEAPVNGGRNYNGGPLESGWAVAKSG